MFFKKTRARRNHRIAWGVAVVATLTLIGALSPVMAEDAPPPDQVSQSADPAAEPTTSSTDDGATDTSGATSSADAGDAPAASDPNNEPNSDPKPLASSRMAPLATSLAATEVSIGDRVWSDSNRNGQQDAGEPGVAGVPVKLYVGTSTTLFGATTTDSSGKYSFTGLGADEQYTLAVTKPAGQAFTEANTGADATDSDVNSSGRYTFTAPSTGSNSSATPDNATIDAGLQLISVTVSCVNSSNAGLFGGFEIDGNLCVQGNVDWDSDLDNMDYQFDGFAGNDSTTLAGAEKDGPQAWTAGSSTNGKSDFGEAWGYATQSGGDVYSYFAFTNDSTSGGTGNYLIEYNQKPNVSNGGLSVPDRTPGDVLLQFASTGSDALALQGLWKYSTTSGNGCSLTGTGYWCSQPLPSGSYKVATNAAGTFIEGGVNFTKLFPSTAGCSAAFGTINIRSITGGSVMNASFKDRVAPLEVSTPSTCGNLVIQKRDAITGDLIGGATFLVTPNPLTGTGSVSVTEGSAQDPDGKADGIVTWGYNVEPGNYTVQETAAPAGYWLASPRTQSTTVGEGGKAVLTFNDYKKFLAPTVTKTAAGTYDATYTWKIDKSVRNNPDGSYGTSAQQALPAGSTASFGYKVAVTQDKETRTNYRVTGALSVSNDNVDPMVVTLSDAAGGVTCTFPGVTDLDGDASNGIQVSLPGKATAGSPAEVTQYSYSCAMPDSAADGTNTATVSWDKNIYPQTQEDADKAAAKKADASKPGAGVGQATGSADYTFAEGKSVNKTITVTDDKHDFGTPWKITWGDPESNLTKTYDSTLTAPSGTCTPVLENTAEIVETGQQDKASTKVCGAATLSVDKNAATKLTRSYLYGVEKTRTGSTSSTVQVPEGDSTSSQAYSVTVTKKVSDTNADGYNDSAFVLQGNIKVTNPNDFQPVTLTSIGDVFSGQTGCVVTGSRSNSTDLGTPATFGWSAPIDMTVAASQSNIYHYQCSWPTLPKTAYETTQSNVATVTWDATAAHTASGTASNTPVTITPQMWTAANSLTPVNATATITDPEFTDADGGHVLGTVAWADLPKTFDSYSVDWPTSPGTCVDRTNTASVAGNSDHIVQDTSSATVTLCQSAGATLSKTASATYDRTYAWELDKFIKNAQGNWVKSASVNTDDYTGSFDYRVQATPLAVDAARDDSNWQMAGKITVTSANTDTRIPAVEVTVQDLPDFGGTATSCTYATSVDGSYTTALPKVSVASNGTAEVFYKCTFDTMPSYTGANQAKATWGSDGVALSDADASTAGAQKTPVTFPSTPSVEHDKTMKVYDNKATSGAAAELGSVTWNDGGQPIPVLPGGEYTASFTAPSLACADFVNTAWLGGTALTQSDVTSSATATVCPNAPKWKVVKSASPADGTEITPGDTVTYTLTATHVSGVPVPSAEVVDDLSGFVPDDAAYAGLVAGSPSAGTVVAPSSANGQKLTWTIPSLSSSATLSFKVTVADTATGATIPNRVIGTNSENCPTATATDPDCTTTHTTKQRPKLTLVKNVDNNGTGATHQPAEWDLSALQGPTTIFHGNSGTAAASQSVDVGSYTFDESGPAGYELLGWKCTGSDGYVSSVSLTWNQDKTCTAYNKAIAPKLHLVKSVDNSAYPSATGVADNWLVQADGPGTSHDYSAPGTAGGVANIGTYTLSEADNPASPPPAGYLDGASWSCVRTGTTTPVSSTDDKVDLALADDVTCTIVNTAVAGTYKINKSSDPGDGATVQPGDTITWTLTAKKTGGVDPTNVVLKDDLTDVLAHTNGVTNIDTGGVGTADIETIDGKKVLVWTIPTLSGTRSMTFSATVKDGEWGVSIGNVVTSPNSSGCITDCETTQVTPEWKLVKTTEAPKLAAPGDTLTYHLTVTNTSDAVVKNAVVKDNLAGLDHVETPAFVGSHEGASFGGTPTSLTWNVPELGVGKSATITYTVTVKPDAFDVKIVNLATASGDGGRCLEASDCTTEHETKAKPKLTLVKVVDNGTTAGDATAGDFTLSATPAQVPDAGTQHQGTVSGPGAGPGAVTAESVLPGTYSLDETKLPHYSQGAWQCNTGPGGAWENVGATGATGSVTLALDAEVTCRVQNNADASSYTVAKSSNKTGTVMPDDEITYTLTAKWAGGVKLTDTVVRDDLTDVLDDGSLVGNLPAGAVLDTTTEPGKTFLVWTIPLLEDTDANRVQTLSYQVKVDHDAWSADLRNVVTPVSPNGGCEEGNTCQTDHPTPDKPKLTLIKHVTNGLNPTATAADWTLSATPGDGVDQAQDVVSGAGGFADASVWPGSYRLSETDDVDGYSAGDWTCDNAQGAVTSVDLEPGDDVTCEITNTQDAVWAVGKTNSAGDGATVQPGDSITYTLRATRIAGVPPTGIVITDDLTDVTPYIEAFDDSQLPAGATRTGDSLVWNVPAFDADTTEQTLTYTVKVLPTAIGVTLKNAITAPGSNCPVDGGLAPLIAGAVTSVLADGPLCETSNPTPEWTLRKSSDPATMSEVAPSSTITYTLHTKNTSDAVLEGATVIDDLSGVLTGAKLNALADDSGLSIDGTKLTWALPRLNPGEEATTSYSVTMTIPAASGGMIVNVAAPGQPTGHCEAEDACTTTHVQNPPPLPPTTPPVVLPPASPPQVAPPAALPNTGGPRLVFLPSGVGLLLLGLGLMLVRRRREG